MTLASAKESCFPGEPFPVYVVDDDPVLRESLVQLLSSLRTDARAFGNSQALLDQLPKLSPGLFLIDIRIGRESGLDLLPELDARSCRWPVAMMTAHGDIPLAVRAVTMGAFEFMEKPFTAARLKVVLDRGRDMLFDILARADQAPENDSSLAGLSERQRQVLEGVVKGLTSKEIAIRLGLSPRTVEAYRTNIMKKLNVRTTADLCRLALLTSEPSPNQRSGR